MRDCRAESTLDFHHIDQDPSNNEPDNLIVLCSNHHRMATDGRVDRKACLAIKKSLAGYTTLHGGGHALLTSLRRVLRQELARTIPKGGRAKHGPATSLSVLNRRFLFATLKHLRDPRDMYLAIRVLGDLAYRGSAEAIIRVIEQLRRTTPRNRRTRFLWEYYLPAVQSLGKISTKRALVWLADELRGRHADELARLVLLMTLMSARNGQRYVGFRILGRKVERHRGGHTTDLRIALRGEEYRYTLRWRVPDTR